MDILNINFNDAIPNIIDAYSTCFGEKYRDVIKRRLKQTPIIYYNNYIGISSYYDFLLQNKQTELFKLLHEKILDFANFNDYNHLIYELVRDYLDSIAWENTEIIFFSKNVLPEDETQLLNKCSDEIQENITNVFNYLKETYEILKNQFLLFEKTLEPLQKIIEKEKIRLRKIDDERLIFFYENAKEYLPQGLTSYLTQNITPLKISALEAFIFTTYQKTADKEDIEYFLSILLDSEYDYEQQLLYMSENDMLPTKENILSLVKISNEINSEYEKIMFLKGPFYEENVKRFKEMLGDKVDVAYFDSLLIAGDSCASSYKSENKNINFICFTIGDNYGGLIEHVFLHEICHAIEISDNCDSSGFESYYKDYNIYENLNETFVDIFAIEASKELHKRGIYFAEPKEYMSESWINFNTNGILRKLVSPLLENYREEIIEARMTGNMNIIFDKIGKENFDYLNDIINRVKKLLDEGLEEAIDNNLDNDLTQMFLLLLDDLRDLYKNIGDYRRALVKTISRNN